MARAHNARAEDVSAQSKPWRNATRQAIHLTVAAVDDCGYCQAAYTGATRAASFEVDETVQIRRGRLEDDPELNALLALVRQIADNRGYVDESEWSAALAAGWTTDSTSRPPPSRSRSVLLTACSIMVAPPVTHNSTIALARADGRTSPKNGIVITASAITCTRSPSSKQGAPSPAQQRIRFPLPPR